MSDTDHTPTAATMTPELSDALRRKFPQDTIGILPKPYDAKSTKGRCNECGGWHGLPAAHLPYVGHAAVTDRLLSVDPQWNWEPVAVDQYGLPMMLPNGDFWIRLTVGGVTRLAVGDGRGMKERIGDAIRNGAMRFGVGLAMWTKDELEFAGTWVPSADAVPVAAATAEEPAPPAKSATAQLRAMATTPTEAPTGPPEGIDAGSGEITTEAAYVAAGGQDVPGITDAQLRKLHATFRDAGMTAKEDRLAWCVEVVGRPLTTSKDLTKDEASAVINKLSKERVPS